MTRLRLTCHVIRDKLRRPVASTLGSEARFNTPGRSEGNWQWRYGDRDLDCLCGTTTRYLRELGDLYDRVPRPAAAEPAGPAP